MDPNLVYFIVSFLSSALSLFLATNALKRRSAPGALAFGIIMVLLAVWTFMVGIGMVTPNQKFWTFITNARISMVIAIPVVWFVFGLRFSKCDSWLRPYHIYLLTIIPVISFSILVTNPLHHLYYKDIQFITSGRFTIEVLWVYSPWFWVHAVYSYTLMAIGSIFLIIRAIQVAGKQRQQAAAVLLGTIFPVMINVFYTFKLIPSIKVDYNPIGFILAGICMSFGLFKYNLFDIKPIARKILVDSMTDPMLVLDDQNELVDFNPVARELFNLSSAQEMSRAVEKLLPANQTLPDKTPIQIEYAHEQNGVKRIFDLQVSPILDKTKFLGRLIVLREITERQALEEKLREMATRDSLTGVLNRRSFYERAIVEVQRARRYAHPFAILFFDLDNFKEINDRHGHICGDSALIHVANTCKAHTRSSDLLTRYGGDEFVIMQPETSQLESTQMANRLRTAISSTPLIAGQAILHITASIGVRFYDPSSEPDLSLEHIIEQADRMMYLSKETGNCVTVWENRFPQSVAEA